MNGEKYLTIAGVNLPRRATWAMFTSVIAATVLCTAFVLKIDARLTRIEEGIGDRWSHADMLIWTERLQDKNEGKIVVPPVQPHRQSRSLDDER